jgi:hypothetical protein
MSALGQSLPFASTGAPRAYGGFAPNEASNMSDAISENQELNCRYLGEILDIGTGISAVISATYLVWAED